MMLDQAKLKQLIQKHSLYLCLECGKCSAVCPRLAAGRDFSPRVMARKVMFEPEDSSYIQTAVWECLTCGACEELCPSGVSFVAFIRDMRAALVQAELGITGYLAHDGAPHSWMRIMTAPNLSQRRLAWLTDELQVADQGPVAFFTGCAPYFDVFFTNLGVDTVAMARDSIRLLNRLGVTPVVLGNERCCGHDLLWTGDQENFEALCRLNHQEFSAAGVQEIITACPECYQVLHDLWPQVVPENPIKVTLMVDFLLEAVEAGRLPLAPLEARVTYQDPCRLGRMAGRYEEPRRLLQAIPGLTLAEMEDNRSAALCCGNSSFVNCDAYAKKLQVRRLGQARDTGAQLLITACPKCLIHTTCALRDPVAGEPWNLETRSLVSLVARQVED